MHSDKSHHRARHHVRLPSGKQIEVVYLDNPLPPSLDGAPGKARTERVEEPLHLCFYCAGEFVHPVDWTEAGTGQWRILLRCPECEATREGVFEQAAVESLDDELDRATGALLERPAARHTRKHGRGDRSVCARARRRPDRAIGLLTARRRPAAS